MARLIRFCCINRICEAISFLIYLSTQKLYICVCILIVCNSLTLQKITQMFSFWRNNLDKLKSFIRNSDEIHIEKEDREKLIKMIRPTIGIKTHSIDDKNIKIGRSKIGGKPDLPQIFDWPRENGVPLLFCAQYNLSELTKFDKENLLPKGGFFYIFLGLDQELNEFNVVNQTFRFIYSASENLIRTDFPNDYQKEHTFKSALMEYFQYYTLPDDENYKLTWLEQKYNNELYFNFYQPTEEFITDELYERYNSMHQILGHDRSIQSSVVYDFASKNLGLYFAESSVYQNRWNEILELSKTYELLLQLDCDDPNTDLSKYGGSGTYYFGIDRNDLKNKNFNSVHMTFQMT